MVQTLTEEEKEKFLRTLETDKNFRYAVAGLIGLKEVLERLEKVEKRIEEHSKRIEDLSKVIAAIGARWGVLSESAFREGMRRIVQDILGVAKVDKWVYFDSEGFVFGRPSVVEVDLVIKDGEHMLIEVKSSVSRGDVLELVRIGELYEKVTGVKPRLMIVSPFVDEKARQLASEFGIAVSEGEVDATVQSE
ncbi:hypothetical protein DRP04_14185 [Archaeoglobales archaeon]|nr:MAG: hypothetical protein DRP04_14185 [Archaeoglobales archaeon]